LIWGKKESQASSGKQETLRSTMRFVCIKEIVKCLVHHPFWFGAKKKAKQDCLAFTPNHNWLFKVNYNSLKYF